MTSNFVPKRRLISNVSQAVRAIVTTDEDHEFEDGQIVRLIVPLAYGMNLDYVQAKIVVLNATQFETDVNTSNEAPFVNPTIPPAFTPAQVVPISGVVDNIAGDP